MKQEIEVTEYDVDGLRIDKYISDCRDIMSRSQLKTRNAVFFINGHEVKYSHKIKHSETITVEYEELQEMDIKPEEMELDIIYEDINVLVLNKKQGVVVHPADGNYSGTLVNGLLYYLENHQGNFDDEIIRPGIVHRLDKETSGVIIVAKNVKTHEYLSAQFRERTTEKKYLAFIKGKPKDKTGRIETYIRRDRINRKKFTTDMEEGKFAITNYRILKKYDRFSLCLLSLETGRTHQLRVHTSYLGNPILGDPVYSRKDQRYPDITLMLHAYTLSIDIPGKGRMRFLAPLPERFKKLIKNNH